MKRRTSDNKEWILRLALRRYADRKIEDCRRGNRRRMDEEF